MLKCVEKGVLGNLGEYFFIVKCTDQYNTGLIWVKSEEIWSKGIVR